MRTGSIRVGWPLAAAVGALSAAAVSWAEPAPASTAPVAAVATTAVNPQPAAALPEVEVTAADPRYVVPTMRDRLGRIWAPVYLNGKGPYKLVLDTGASDSAIIVKVATALGLYGAGSMMLHGVTGSALVPFVTVNSFAVGDLETGTKALPIVPDALGGADGVLGTEGMQGRRIFIDFMHDQITISRSHSVHAPVGYQIIPLVRTAKGLLMTTAYVNGIRVKAIIDTGGQATVANRALLDALRTRRWRDLKKSLITGATDAVQPGEDLPMPPIRMGPLIIQAPILTVSDLRIFELWNLTQEPAMLIGIDTLGLLDQMVIDYQRMELQVRTRPYS